MANIILRFMLEIKLAWATRTYYSFAVHFAEMAQHKVIIWLVFRLFSL